VKGTAAFEAIRKLTTWRNAAAHGHCVDRPTSGLRKNHLINPEEFPSVPVVISELQARLGDYFRVKRYLQSISINNYTSARSVHDEVIADFLEVISTYRFENVNGQAYDVHRPQAS
jgi:hypothetical protein